MTDVHDKKTRSYNMSQIKGKNTKPEIMVRKFLFANGFRYKLHDKKLPGKPDIVLPKYKTVVFIQGCFWHGHTGCRYFIMPKSNTEFWIEKIGQNQKRDIVKFSELEKLGWHVYLIYECELKKDKKEQTLNSLVKFLKEREVSAIM
ncbi:very short patch repair endonuclease [Emticicia sp. C21]|uniref:very short patch repair endonuclease n=1 Tax=Emticicia sp. C21 TaxID=2302915 RepID=UPI000E3451E3|nr:DNA mismatch endonuclease Vsr [Emticicia sp. C21]RFS17342.1 DNA mismatch endonuclease Vsr [Emticicia sp. C21]